ncbi:pyridoxamine 5'-phosphate oxidase family protein [Halohasta litorea]|uniref:Pyridoxamine 5'-phosphate oxidase family protein n=1 Tax=Halohasta litorea TaxID=869891 RepID=A0ABD6D9T2_9EURY|nr:pyridoxamine 5'-phosphate oxidase family protein [Halohasta litorea]
MSQNLYAQFSGTPMSRDDIDRLLEDQGYGILSLCGDGTPYSVPLSFGYDGESVALLFLSEGPQSRKADAISEGATARLLVTDIRGRFDWQSVAVTGPVHAVAPDSEAFEQFIATLDDNAWFIRGFERANSLESIQGWRLDPETVRGLERREQPSE